MFNTKDVARFDNINLDCYQVIDNQKTTLSIRNDGVVINKSKKYNFDCFNNKFFNDFNALELEIRKSKSHILKMDLINKKIRGAAVDAMEYGKGKEKEK